MKKQERSIASTSFISNTPKESIEQKAPTTGKYESDLKSQTNISRNLVSNYASSSFIMIDSLK